MEAMKTGIKGFEYAPSKDGPIVRYQMDIPNSNPNQINDARSFMSDKIAPRFASANMGNMTVIATTVGSQDTTRVELIGNLANKDVKTAKEISNFIKEIANQMNNRYTIAGTLRKVDEEERDMVEAMKTGIKGAYESKESSVRFYMDIPNSSPIIDAAMKFINSKIWNMSDESASKNITVTATPGQDTTRVEVVGNHENMDRNTTDLIALVIQNIWFKMSEKYSVTDPAFVHFEYP
jgi:hypothetical protein